MSSDLAQRRRGIGRGLAFIVSGPSGAGKNSVIDRVLEEVPRLVYSISCTTRPRRDHEIDGEDYVFIEHDEFVRRVEEGEFVEYVTYLDHLYGTSKSQIDRMIKGGNDVILNIDVEGARRVRRSGLGRADAVFVFLVPSSLAKLRDRLAQRGTETEEQITDRLDVAASEMRTLGEFDYLVINDDIETAAAELQAIVEAERLRIQ